MTAAYDTDNVFAKILRGEIPCHKVYEDADTLAFMDIMPRGEGHVLVIPKKPVRNVLDVDEETHAAVYRTVRKLAPVAVKASRSAAGTISGSAIATTSDGSTLNGARLITTRAP